MFSNTVLICKCLLKCLPLSEGNVYKYLWRYYGMFISKTFGQFVTEQLRMHKIKNAIKFIRKCKNEELIPTFARVHFANPYIADAKLRQKCARHILQTEMKFKQCLLNRTKRYLT